MHNTQVTQLPTRRPSLALVIGSGGVRSIAAAGIIQVLERENIVPDLIVGCSSGALIGSTLAMKMPSDEVLSTVMKFWSDELTQQRKWLSYAQIVAPKLARFGPSFSLRDDRLIRSALEQGFGERRIEDLPIALRITATSAQDGRPVVLTRGRVVDAVRASMAVPILFPSVEVNGQRLFDGVLSDPLPLSAARDARVVIALGFAGAMPRRIDRMSRMVAQTSTALINNLMQARVEAACAQGQQVINIELQLTKRVGLWQTDALPYLFEQGQQAALARLDEIKERLSHRSSCDAPSMHTAPLAI
ncbi:MAG: patatin-like phospholipase family protein [Burkholderiaceae bacterium]